LTRLAASDFPYDYAMRISQIDPLAAPLQSVQCKVQGLLRIGIKLLVALLPLSVAPMQSSVAMDFARAGDVIVASGEIVHGDAEEFMKFITVNNMIATDDFDTIGLSSPGGNLFEGMALGEAIRKARFNTVVGRGTTCASACALAFLGGTARYATGTGPGRTLEFGGWLGFHGFRFSDDKLVLLNESVETSRVVTALILEYAERMTGVDIGWLSHALNVSSGNLIFVRRPKDIFSLFITLKGIPQIVPNNWYFNACRKVVNKNIPPIDDFGNRITGENHVIKTIRLLREQLVSARYGSGPIVSALAPLTDAEALDSILEEPFYLNQIKPILEARSVKLERGAGFYFDQCVVIRSKEALQVILADAVGNRLRSYSFSGQGQKLAMFDDDVDLW
jgi:hypothetical protein